MIGRMSYVICDECGAPGEMADDAAEAREAPGFVQIDGRDLCWSCNPNSGRCLTCGVRPKNLLSGCTSRDGIHTLRASSKEVQGDGG